ncbi:MFS general substrate transporter [Backusella circina FSU 941]|nr:MFS general substrate transporter [Backusella circina FSU 941]
MYYTSSNSSLSTHSSESIKETQSTWSRARKSPISVAVLVGLILFTDMLVYGSVIPCLPAIVIHKLHGTAKDIGILFGCFAFGYLLATPIFAILSDNYKNRRYPLIIGSGCIVLSTLCFSWANTYVVLAIARLFQGASAGASWTIGLGMLAEVFSVDRLGAVMGTVILSHTIGFVLGPVLGGVLYDYGGVHMPFYLCALFGLFSLVGTCWIAEPIDSEDQETNNRKNKSRDSESEPLLEHQHQQQKKMHYYQDFVDLLKDKRILACVLCCFVTSASLAGMEPALPVYLQEKYHVSTSVVGMIFIAMVIPSFLGPVTGYLSDRFGRPLFIGVGMIIMSLASVLISIQVSSMYYMIPSLLLFGFSNPLIHTPLMPEMASIVDDIGNGAFAQVYALYNMSYSIGILVGPIVAGFLMSINTEHFQTLMIVFSLSILVCVPFMFNTNIFQKKK